MHSTDGTPESSIDRNEVARGRRFGEKICGSERVPGQNNALPALITGPTGKPFLAAPDAFAYEVAPAKKVTNFSVRPTRDRSYLLWIDVSKFAPTPRGKL
jgi:hypothetical protein